MARKASPKGFGIAVTHPDGVVGWLTNPDATVELYQTQEEAEQALKRRRKDKRYTWTLPMEAKRYHENEV